ncbi:MAG: DHH family phosphoesterase [Planctomycetia bacterium]|nr:DHH family phosphoesterase [Planctomycetia bacterium]
MTIAWPRFVELVRNHRRFVLTSHVRPDCDALGSELGMAGALEALGKEARIVNPHSTPPVISFIDPDRRVRKIGTDVSPREVLDWADVLFVLDTSAWIQLAEMGDLLRETKGQVIVLDHHQSSDTLPGAIFRDAGAEATGVLVVEAADRLGVKITPPMARALFAAIATDTGWFRFSSTKPSTYTVAGRLVEAGASPVEIYRCLYEQDSLARLQLRGRVLAKAQTDLDGRLIHTAATMEDFAATGARSSDTEEIVNATLTVAGVELALFFVELAADRCKVSFRSRSAVDCSELAAKFGGGGHKAAAGASFKGAGLSEVYPKVLDAARAAMG